VSTAAGEDAVDLARLAGLRLDPWQQLSLRESLAETAAGKWASFEVCLLCTRQNGKGSILEARELAGLFLLGERLILHSAHEFKTAAEAFLRILSLIENTPDLDREVAAVSRSKGDEGIRLKSGQRLRFVARSAGSGRGFTGDCVILDEAYEMSEAALSALMPTMSARPNPQLWYASSAVDKKIHHNGRVLASVRRRGIKGDDPSLCFLEWSADDERFARLQTPAERRAFLDNPRNWAVANPGMGIRISEEHIARERRAMGDGFAVERLGIGDWPAVEGDEWVIPEADWTACADPESVTVGTVAFGIDVSPDRRGCIAVAGQREDGLEHGEVIDTRNGTRWIVDRCVDLRDRHSPSVFALDPAGPAGALIPDFEDAGIEVDNSDDPAPGSLVLMSGRDMAQACGALFNKAVDHRVRHLDQPELNAALAGAKKRPLGDAWAWDRKNSADIAPLVSYTAIRISVSPGWTM
jgi:hypothetical protein